MRYKLTQEYPNSPKVGHIIKECEEPGLKNYYTSVKEDDDCSRIGMLHISEIVRCPNIWQEVVEKDYEILSFIHNDGIIVIKNDYKNGQKSWENAFNLLENYKIHSVKRLSDGEIFTIGDKCKDVNTNCTTKVSEITLKNTICFINGVNINYLEKVKQSLFTTEDGVDIYEDDTYYLVNKKEVYLLKSTPNSFFKRHKNEKIFKYFKDIEEAEKYISLNKSKYSLNDVIASIPKYASHYKCMTKLVENLKNM